MNSLIAMEANIEKGHLFLVCATVWLPEASDVLSFKVIKII